MLRSAQRQLKEQAMLAFASLSSCGGEAAELLPKAIKLETAKALGLIIPSMLLFTADEVIELAAMAAVSLKRTCASALQGNFRTF